MKKKKLLTLFICLVLVLVALLLPACAKPAPPAPAPAPAPAPPPAPAPAPPPAPAPVTPTAPEIKPVTLVMQDYAPSGAKVETEKWWMDEVTKRSGGRITFDAYFAESLVPARESLEATSTGLCDVGMLTLSYATALLPLHDVSNIPLGAASFKAGAYAFRDLYEEFPGFRAELLRQGVKMLFIEGTPPMQLHFAKKPVRKLEDMKGLKVRSYGVSAGKILKTWGAIPVAMPYPEIYEALKLGTIDGTVSYLYAVGAYRHQEVGKYYVVGNFGALPCQLLLINLKTWESLGPAAQKIFQETANEAQDILIDYYNRDDLAAFELMREADVDIYELPPEERAEWVKKGRFVWDEWAKEIDAKGLPGTEIVTRYLELAEEYEK